MFFLKKMNNRLWQRAIAKVLVVMLLVSMIQLGTLVYAAAYQAFDGTVYVNDTTIQADGTSQTSVVLLLKDQVGNDVSIPPERVKFRTTLGHLDGNVISSVYGQYTSVLTASVTAGMAYVSAEVDGIVIPDIAVVNFKAGMPSPEHSIITASTQSMPADGSSQTVISLLLKDQYGNDVADQADSVQLFTTSGNLSSVTYETYGRYETTIVSAVYGRLGGLTGSLGPVGPLNLIFEQGAIPAGTPNSSPIPAALSQTYTSTSSYKAILTAPSTAGGTRITANLNGVPVTSSVYVAFTEGSLPIVLTGIRFDQTSYSLVTGQQQSTRLGAILSNGIGSDVTPNAAYTIMDPSIATVDNRGTVQAWKRGSTVLTATYGGLSAETSILVTDPVTEDVQPTQNPPAQGSLISTPAPLTGLKIDVISENGQSKQQVLSPEGIKQGVIGLEIPSVGGRINITADNIKGLKDINPQAVLVIQAGSAVMSLPISELNPKEYSSKYQIPEDSIRFEVIIREPDPAAIQTIRQSIGTMKAQLLTAPIEFEVRVTGENHQSVFISTFNRYVSRTLPLNIDFIPETATGVWWVPGSNGFRYVPTSFEQKNGQWLAVMKRKGASIYSVIDYPVSFSDVQGHWSSKDVELLASKLIIQGRSKEAFDPDGTITRAEIAALLVRSLGLNDSNEKKPFLDVTEGWYETAVSTAYQAGLISGYEDGTFRPNQRITREELVTMVVRAMNYTAIKPNGGSLKDPSFADKLDISRWALDDVRAAGQLGIINGDGMFRPASDSTRAEAVTMLKRMLKLIEFI